MALDIKKHQHKPVPLPPARPADLGGTGTPPKPAGETTPKPGADTLATRPTKGAPTSKLDSTVAGATPTGPLDPGQLAALVKQRTGVLKRGSNDDTATKQHPADHDVSETQQRLTQLKKPDGSPYLQLKPGEATGHYGPKTQEAITQFQKDHNLQKIDGKVGPETMAALNEAIAQQNLQNQKPATPAPAEDAKKPKPESAADATEKTRDAAAAQSKAKLATGAEVVQANATVAMANTAAKAEQQSVKTETQAASHIPPVAIADTASRQATEVAQPKLETAADATQLAGPERQAYDDKKTAAASTQATADQAAQTYQTAEANAKGKVDAAATSGQQAAADAQTAQVAAKKADDLQTVATQKQAAALKASQDADTALKAATDAAKNGDTGHIAELTQKAKDAETASVKAAEEARDASQAAAGAAKDALTAAQTAKTSMDKAATDAKDAQTACEQAEGALQQAKDAADANVKAQGEMLTAAQALAGKANTSEAKQAVADATQAQANAKAKAEGLAQQLDKAKADTHAATQAATDAAHKADAAATTAAGLVDKAKTAADLAKGAADKSQDALLAHDEAFRMAAAFADTAKAASDAKLADQKAQESQQKAAVSNTTADTAAASTTQATKQTEETSASVDQTAAKVDTAGTQTEARVQTAQAQVAQVTDPQVAAGLQSKLDDVQGKQDQLRTTTEQLQTSQAETADLAGQAKVADDQAASDLKAAQDAQTDYAGAQQEADRLGQVAQQKVADAVAATQAIDKAPPAEREGLRQKASQLHNEAAAAEQAFATAQRHAADLGQAAQQKIATAETSRGDAEKATEAFAASAKRTNDLATTAQGQAQALSTAVTEAQQALAGAQGKLANDPAAKANADKLQAAIGTAQGLTQTAKTQVDAVNATAARTTTQLQTAQKAVTDQKAALTAVTDQHATTNQAAAASVQSADEAEKAAREQAMVAAQENPGGLTDKVGKDLESASHDWTAGGYYSDIRDTLFEAQTASDFYAIAQAARQGSRTAEHADTIQALADARTDATRLALRDAYARPETNMEGKLNTAIQTARTPEDRAAVVKVIQRLKDEGLTKMSPADAQGYWGSHPVPPIQ